MKKILLTLVLVGMGGIASAATVSETSGVAAVTLVNVSTGSAVDMSSSTLVAIPFAYNVCNEDASVKIRCGYSSLVSASSSSNYFGFRINPGECEYRAVSNKKLYCIAEGVSATAVKVTREIFGTP